MAEAIENPFLSGARPASQPHPDAIANPFLPRGGQAQQAQAAPSAGLSDIVAGREDIPLTSFANASAQGAANIVRGAREAVGGVASLFAPPEGAAENVAAAIPGGLPVLRTAKGVGELASQALQVPGAVSDIAQSADPLGSAARVAQNTAGEGAGQALVAMATEGVAKGAAKGTKAGVKFVKDANPHLTSSVEELTGTTPARIQELKSVPQKVEAVRQTVVDAEKAAHATAKLSFPDVKTPVEIAPGKSFSFAKAQELRSNVLKEIVDEKRAVNKGAAPRYNLAKLNDALNKLDAKMNAAAKAEGKLPALQRARAVYAEYMQDFHNPGSPMRGILNARPMDTPKIVNALQNPSIGPRALEILRKSGVDTGPIEDLLSRGKQPLKVSVNESAKLRSAGSDAHYKYQRLQESLSQARNKGGASTVEARLPDKAVGDKGMFKVGPTPRSITAWRLERALSKMHGGR